jgi:hypothetical protein
MDHRKQETPMKKTFVLPLLLSTLPCLGQQVGLTFGTAVFVPSASMYSGETTQPKNVCGSLAFLLSDDVKLGFSAGYGFEDSMVHLKTMDEYERRIRLNGFPLEMDIQISKPLVILSGIRPFLGLGCGYYSYKSKTTVRSAGIRSVTDAEIKGPAQYFTFGLDYRMSRRISASIQFKKLGISGIKMEWADPNAVPADAKSQISVKSESGLGDLSITLGMMLNLRTGRESSILEKLQ